MYWPYKWEDKMLFLFTISPMAEKLHSKMTINSFQKHSVDLGEVWGEWMSEITLFKSLKLKWAQVYKKKELGHTRPAV